MEENEQIGAQGEGGATSNSKTVWRRRSYSSTPTCRPTSAPSRKKIRVGRPMTWQRAATSGFSSTSNAATSRSSPSSSRRNSMCADTIEQGWHHSAQKSTTTGRSAARTTASKSASATATGWRNAGAGGRFSPGRFGDRDPSGRGLPAHWRMRWNMGYSSASATAAARISKSWRMSATADKVP